MDQSVQRHLVVIFELPVILHPHPTMLGLPHVLEDTLPVPSYQKHIPA